MYDFFRESKNPKLIYDWAKYKIQFAKEHPDYFHPEGLTIFCGGQGSGKTLSGVNYITNVMKFYPKCKLVTNVQIEEYPIVTFQDYVETVETPENFRTLLEKKNFMKELYEEYLINNRVFPFNNDDDFKKYNNGECGVIFFVDEISLYLNSLESKNINMDTVTELSQQRKQRKHIVATSQVFGRMGKPLREQFNQVLLCRNYFGFVQVNSLIDRDSMSGQESTGTNISGDVKKKFIYFHDPEMYKRYDTYYKIERNKFISGEKMLDIYNNNVNLISLGDKKK